MAVSAQRLRKRDFELPSGPGEARPLGERIKAFVIARIDSGDWPEGHHVPAEGDLADLFGTARMTVHSALKDLAAEGLLQRRPGAGTRVAARKPRATLMEVRNIQDEIIERGHRHAAKVKRLAAEACDLAIATELEVPPGSVVYHSVIVHYEDDRPVQLENRYVSPAFAARYIEQDFRHRTPNEYLMSLGPLDEVEHVIQAFMPDAATRTLLAMSANEPVLHVRRRTWSGSRVVSTARLVHPGSRYSLVGRQRVSASVPP
jgi:GntR family histidine utilization transcriptional repressor